MSDGRLDGVEPADDALVVACEKGGTWHEAALVARLRLAEEERDREADRWRARIARHLSAWRDALDAEEGDEHLQAINEELWEQIDNKPGLQDPDWQRINAAVRMRERAEQRAGGLEDEVARLCSLLCPEGHDYAYQGPRATVRICRRCGAGEP